MNGGLLYKFFVLKTLFTLLINFLTMITHATGLSKFLGNIWSSVVVYKAEYEDYFIGGGMGVTAVGKHKMEISDSKPNSKPSSNKFITFRIEEIDFCTSFVGGLPGNKYLWFDERRQWFFQQVQDP